MFGRLVRRSTVKHCRAHYNCPVLLVVLLLIFGVILPGTRPARSQAEGASRMCAFTLSLSHGLLSSASSMQYLRANPHPVPIT